MSLNTAYILQSAGIKGSTDLSKKALLGLLFQKLDSLVASEELQMESTVYLTEHSSYQENLLINLVQQYETQQLNHLKLLTEETPQPMAHNMDHDSSNIDEQQLASSISRLESQKRQIFNLNLLNIKANNQLRELSLNRQFSTDEHNHGRIFVNEQVVNVAEGTNIHSQQFTAPQVNTSNQRERDETNVKLISQQRKSYSNPMAPDASQDGPSSQARDLIMTHNQSPILEFEKSSNRQLSNSRVPRIPKLNLLQIAQDQKALKNKRDSSLGAAKQNLIGTAGSPALIQTPDQQLTSTHFLPPTQVRAPLTSHYPLLSSCSAEKRMFQWLLYYMNNTNRSAEGSVQSDLPSFDRVPEGFDRRLQSGLQIFLADQRAQRSTERAAKLLSAQQLRASLGGVSEERREFQRELRRNAKNLGAEERTRSLQRLSFNQQKSNLLNRMRHFQTQISQLSKRGMLPFDMALGRSMNQNLNKSVDTSPQQLFLQESENVQEKLNDSAENLATNSQNRQRNNLSYTKVSADAYDQPNSQSFIIETNESRKVNTKLKLEQLGCSMADSFIMKDIACLQAQQREYELETEAINARYTQINPFLESQKPAPGPKTSTQVDQVEVNLESQKVLSSIVDVLKHMSEQELATFNTTRAINVLLKLLQSKNFRQIYVFHEYSTNAVLIESESNSPTSSLAFEQSINTILDVLSSLNEKTIMEQNMLTFKNQLSKPEIEKFHQLEVLNIDHLRKYQLNPVPDPLNQRYLLYQEVARRKFDTILYKVSCQIVKLIKQQAVSAVQMSQSPVTSQIAKFLIDLKWIDPAFIQQLTNCLIVLDYYLRNRKREVSLQSCLDVILEPILMLKRLIVDVTLRQRYLDYDQSVPITSLIQNSILQNGYYSQIEDKELASPSAVSNGYSLQEIQIQAKIGLNQTLFKNMMAQTLKIIETMANLASDQNQFQLLNENFISNNAWQTTVESYIKNLAHQDIISQVMLTFHHNYASKLQIENLCIIYENLEQLRGICAQNLDYSSFVQQIQYFEEQIIVLTQQQIKLVDLTEVQVHKILTQFRQAVKYQTSSLNFLNRAADIIFSEPLVEGEPDQQSAVAASKTQDPHSESKIEENNQYSVENFEGTELNKAPKFDDSYFLNNQSLSAKQKYWKAQIRASLHNIRFLFEGKGRNIVRDNVSNLMPNLSQNQTSANPNDSMVGHEGKYTDKSCLIEEFFENYQSSSTQAHQNMLADQFLDFLHQLFKVDEKFTKYFAMEDIISYSARLHFSQFVKAYQSKEPIQEQSKKHLRNLIQLASTKSQETREIMAKLNILQFMMGEISLEFKCKQRQNQFKKHFNKSYLEEEESPAKTVDLSRHSRNEIMIQQADNVHVSEPPVQTVTDEISPEQPPQFGLGDMDDSDSDAFIPPMPIQHKSSSGFVPKLGIGNLGLSTLAKNGEKTAEEMADMALLHQQNPTRFPEPSVSPQIPQLIQQPVVPSLSPVPALGQAQKVPQFNQTAPPVQSGKPNPLVPKLGQPPQDDVMKQGSSASDAQVPPEFLNYVFNEREDDDSSDDFVPPPIPTQSKKFVPGLKISGLSLSTVSNAADGKTAEEMADEQTLQQAKLAKIKEQSEVSQSEVSSHKDELAELPVGNSIEESDSSDGALPPPLPIQTTKKVIPGLKIGGLSLSTVVKEGDKMTAEQMMDSNILAEQMNKPQGPVPDDSEDSAFEGGDKSERSTGKQNSRREPKPNFIHFDHSKQIQVSQNLMMKQQFKTLSHEDMPLEQLKYGSQIQVKNTQRASKQSNQPVINKVPQIKLKNQALVQQDSSFPSDARRSNRIIKINKQKLAAVLEQQTRQPSSNTFIQLPRKVKKKPIIEMSQKEFYQTERLNVKLYADVELHALMLKLILSLLLKPNRGTLDPKYCEQYPINNGKENYLFILQKHFSREENSQVINHLVNESDSMQSKGMRRLIRLLCPKLFDISLYPKKTWKKLAEGAYGKVYQCETKIKEPKFVAIKQMDLPNDVSERCVLHDIFNEITCLEELRNQNCVTDLYDFGADKTSYYIVMKKYDCSLRQWRLAQGDSIDTFRQNLKLYTSIYLKVLKGIKIIHQNNITHYDIKCDNVMLQFKSKESEESTDPIERVDIDDIEVAIGDFGESNLFSNDVDEFCRRNLGTNCIKSPEMLLVEKHACKEDLQYDRRKKVGTTRQSDIWSTGCLFYELCTGDYLLHEEDWLLFLHRVISHKEELISQEKLTKIDSNQYIQDFLKFILIRDQRLRPSIDKVISHFELIHAIMNNLGSTQSASFKLNSQPSDYSQDMTKLGIKSNQELHSVLRLTSDMMKQDQLSQRSKLAIENKTIQRINETIFFCEANLFNSGDFKQELLEKKVTHIVLPEAFSINRFKLLKYGKNTVTFNSAFQAMPFIIDFVRQAKLHHGKVLFVENEQESLMKEILLIYLNQLHETSVFDTFTLIKAQNLLFNIEHGRLEVIARWNQQFNQIQAYLRTFPQFSCHCGACLIILERSYAQYQNIQQLWSSDCDQNTKSLSPFAEIDKSSCQAYLDFLEKYFILGGQGKTHIQNKPLASRTSRLLWAQFDDSDFILGPCYDKISCIHDTSESGGDAPSAEWDDYARQIASGLSLSISCNSVTESQSPNWDIYKCSVCQVWTHGHNKTTNKYAVILNNRVAE